MRILQHAHFLGPEPEYSLRLGASAKIKSNEPARIARLAAHEMRPVQFVLLGDC